MKPTSYQMNDAIPIPVDRQLTANAERLSAAKRELWLAENREAMAAYNPLVEDQGGFSDQQRFF